MALRPGGQPQRVISLCSGIGALDYGLRLAAPTARTVCYVEGEAFSVACLVEAMRSGALDDAPIWSDLRTFDGGPWRGAADCIIAGFPCQDISIAGRGEGIQPGNRSGLWFEVARVIRDVRPRWVFLENVPAITFRGLDAVLGSLAELGFDAEWCCLPASAVGSPQRRNRWFLLAHSDDEGRRETLGWKEEGGRPVVRLGDVGRTLCRKLRRQRRPRDVPGEAGADQGQENQRQRDGDVADGPVRVVGNAHNAGPQGRLGPIGGVPDGLPAWPPGPTDDAGWEVVLAACPWVAPALPTEPAFCLLADGHTVVSDPAHRIDRLRCLGNSVVPQQAALAYSILRARFDEEGV